MTFPAHGTPADQLLAAAKERRAGDLDWQSGGAFSLVYNVGDEEHERLLHDVAGAFPVSNAGSGTLPDVASVDARGTTGAYQPPG